MRCSICYQCKSAMADQMVRFFHFPTDRHFLEKWLEKCDPRSRVNQNSRVCSRHFIESDFEDGLKARLLGLAAKKLKPTAIPSVDVFEVYEENSTSPQKKRSERVVRNLHDQMIGKRKRQKKVYDDKADANVCYIYEVSDSKSDYGTENNTAECHSEDTARRTIDLNDYIADIPIEEADIDLRIPWKKKLNSVKDVSSIVINFNQNPVNGKKRLRKSTEILVKDEKEDDYEELLVKVDNLQKKLDKQTERNAALLTKNTELSKEVEFWRNIVLKKYLKKGKSRANLELINELREGKVPQDVEL